MDAALKCKESGLSKVIVFNNGSRSHFDLDSYEKFLAGKLEDTKPSEARRSRKHWRKLPKVG
jgi:hypothetical protein